MKHRAVKVGLTGAVLLLAFGGMLRSTLSEDAEYYKHVDEVMAAPEQWEGKRLQLHGIVRSKHVKPGTLEHLFKVENQGAAVWAQYTGVTPDTFLEESEVVLKGTLARSEAGLMFQVEPNGIIAKCPSKYEARAGVPDAPGAAVATAP